MILVLIARLHLENGELDNLIWEKELDEPGEKHKWLALAKVELFESSWISKGEWERMRFSV